MSRFSSASAAASALGEPAIAMTQAFLTRSTGIIVIARSATTHQPVMPNGTQLNILPMNLNGASGISEQFTMSAWIAMIAAITFKKFGFSLRPLKMPNPSSRTLKPFARAARIKSTK